MRLATVDEAPIIRDHYDKVTNHANTVGFIDWPLPFPIEIIETIISKRELYVWGDGNIATTLKISTEVPETIWGLTEENRKYIYLGKLAASESVRGTGYVTKTVMHDIQAYAKSLGKSGLRLDCLLDNDGLCRFYTELGYTLKGVSTFWSEIQQKDITVNKFELEI